MVTDADVDRLAKKRAYVIAAFGEIPTGIWPGDTPTFTNPAMLDTKSQRKFREVCEITTFGNFSNYVNNLLVGDPFDLDCDRHEPAERLGMCNILQAFGFASPFDHATVQTTGANISAQQSRDLHPGGRWAHPPSAGGDGPN